MTKRLEILKRIIAPLTFRENMIYFCCLNYPPVRGAVATQRFTLEHRPAQTLPCLAIAQLRR